MRVEASPSRRDLDGYGDHGMLWRVIWANKQNIFVNTSQKDPRPLDTSETLRESLPSGKCDCEVEICS